jgi:hypothetical protein
MDRRIPYDHLWHAVLSRGVSKLRVARFVVTTSSVCRIALRPLLEVSAHDASSDDLLFLGIQNTLYHGAYHCLQSVGVSRTKRSRSRLRSTSQFAAA